MTEAERAARVTASADRLRRRITRALADHSLSLDPSPGRPRRWLIAVEVDRGWVMFDSTDRGLDPPYATLTESRDEARAFLAEFNAAMAEWEQGIADYIASSEARPWDDARSSG